MSESGGKGRPERADISSEILVDTPILNKISDGGTAGPIDFTDKLVARVRDNVRMRRTESAVAQRIADASVRPISDALERELSESLKRSIESRRRK